MTRGTKKGQNLVEALSHRCRQRSVGSIRKDREGRPAVKDGVRNEIRVCLRRPAEGRRQVEQGRRDGEQGVVDQNAGNGGVVEPERESDGLSQEKCQLAVHLLTGVDA